MVLELDYRFSGCFVNAIKVILVGFMLRLTDWHHLFLVVGSVDALIDGFLK